MPGVLLRTAVQPIAGLLGDRKRAKIVIARPRGSDLEFLGRLADAGKLQPVIDRLFPLDQVREAHDHSETERARGKIVLRVS
jgi:NADPH:quinone reductase-like Zn-dependent oxidoreductase